MGTLFEVFATGADETALRAAAEEALAEIDRLEDQMSLYLPTSEICAINAAGGAERVEPRLYALFVRARELHAMTGGTFDIACAPLVRAWSFLDGVRGNVRAARRVSGMRHVRLQDGSVRFARRGVALDLGGIGKGYALDRAAAILRQRGVTDALLHGGASTILAIGTWPVGLADPRDPERRLGQIELRDRALSASSGLGKFFVERGREIGHILDPRTGSPARGTDAAWAVADSAADADALSTAFYVMGAKAAQDFCRAHPEFESVVLAGKLTGRPVAPAPPRATTFSRRTFLQGTAAAAAFVAGTAAAQDPPPAREKAVKLAVIGTGEHGRLLLSQLVRMPAVKVAAICDIAKAAREKTIEITGKNCETYETVKQLLDEEEIDAVVVATPPAAHAEATVAALGAGLAVFCEAPLAHTAEDCRKIADAAKKAKKALVVGHHRRFGKLYPHALKHIKSNAAGNLRLFRAQWHRKMSWRRPGEKAPNWRLYKDLSCGLIGEFGVHVVDMANWYLDAAPKSALGLGSLIDWKDGRTCPDTVNVVFEYPGGQQLAFSASLGSSYAEEFDLIMGSNASILLTNQRKGLLFKEPDAVEFGWEHFAKKEMLGSARGILLDAEATKYKTHDQAEEIGPDAGKADFHAEMLAFLACVRTGGPSPCGAEEGLRAAIPCIAAMEAIEKRTLVEIAYA